MPVVTWTRSLDPVIAPYLFTGNQVSYNDKGYEVLLGGNQTTTSYRSSQAGGNKENEHNELSGEDLRKSLRSEHKLRFDNGNEFSTEKYIRIYPQLNCGLTRRYTPSANYSAYSGSLSLSILGSFAAPSSYYLSDALKTLDGTKAVNMTIPTAPEAGLAQFVGELKEKLPQLMGLQTLKKGISANSVGSEYLNLEFGIKPFISDLQQMAVSVQKAHKIIGQLRRDSDKVVRRGTMLREDSRIVQYAVPGSRVVQMSRRNGVDVRGDYFASQGTKFVSDVITDKAWFKGAYSYHLAEAHDFLGKMELYSQYADKLLGTDINASTIYELTPWSWLLDWFGNMGTFLSNISLLSSDSTVLRYGYIMHTTKVARTHISIGCTPAVNAGGVPSSISTIEEFTSKTRKRATPYGFGLDISSFSPRRWAILAALGMTRGVSPDLKLRS